MTKTWNTKPDSEFYDLELPEINKQAAKEAYHMSKGILLSDSQLASFWRVFKIEVFDGETHYQSAVKSYTHFIRWIRTKIVIPQALSTREEPSIIMSPLDLIRLKYQKTPRSVTYEEWNKAYEELIKLCMEGKVKDLPQSFLNTLIDTYGYNNDFYRKSYAMKHFDDGLIR